MASLIYPRIAQRTSKGIQEQGAAMNEPRKVLQTMFTHVNGIIQGLEHSGNIERYILAGVQSLHTDVATKSMELIDQNTKLHERHTKKQQQSSSLLELIEQRRPDIRRATVDNDRAQMLIREDAANVMHLLA